MSGFADYKDRVNRHFGFTSKEIKALLISIIVIGFIVSFKDWVLTPEGALDILITLKNIINGIIVAALVLLIHETAWRLWAIWLGFNPESKIWWPGLITGVLLAFVSNGNLWFIAAPAVFISLHPTHRLGHFRYGLNMNANGWICIFGISSVILFAVLLKILLFYLPANYLLHKALAVCIWFTIINMLPIPPLDGTRIFFMAGGPLIYIFYFSLVIGFAILLSVSISALWQIWLLLLGALVIGVIGWLSYLNMVHNK